MKLRVLDQIHVSSVQADVLRPKQEITVTKAKAAELLKDHPSHFEEIAEDDGGEGGKQPPVVQPAPETPAPASKAEAAAASNKAEPGAPKNKAAPAAPAPSAGS